MSKDIYIPLLPLKCKDMVLLFLSPSLSFFLFIFVLPCRKIFTSSVNYFAYSCCHSREEEHSKLSEELERQPKMASRSSHIQRIKEITKNSRKQDADIERIVKETRELQLESNSIQERLHRTYAVADEMVFRY